MCFPKAISPFLSIINADGVLMFVDRKKSGKYNLLTVTFSLLILIVIITGC